MVPPKGSEVPLAWLWETLVPHRRLLEGSAGPGSQTSVATPSLHSLRSCLGRRQVVTHNRTQRVLKSLGASPLHTVARKPCQASPEPSKSKPEAPEGSRPRKSCRVGASSAEPKAPCRGKPSFCSFLFLFFGLQGSLPSTRAFVVETARAHARPRQPQPDPAVSLEAGPSELPVRRRLNRKQHALGGDEDTGHEPLIFPKRRGTEGRFTWTGPLARSSGLFPGPLLRLAGLFRDLTSSALNKARGH